MKSDKKVKIFRRVLIRSFAASSRQGRITLQEMPVEVMSTIIREKGARIDLTVK